MTGFLETVANIAGRVGFILYDETTHLPLPISPMPAADFV
jgi:hypothetical protein